MSKYIISGKMERFAVLYATKSRATKAGDMTLPQLYYEAYPDFKGNKESATSGAKRLLRHEGVRERIRELRNQVAQVVTIATGIELAPLMERLWTEATREGQGSTHSARVAALGIIAARVWPVPQGESEKPKAITVRVIYEDEKGKGGVEVQVE